MVAGDGYRRKSHIALVVFVVLASLALVSLLVTLTYYCYTWVKRQQNPQIEDAGCDEKSGSADLQVVVEKGLQVFTFKQLHCATGGFSESNVIGHGGFGLIYRGVLNDRKKVAIKFMDQERKQGEEEFKVEVEMLSRLRSPFLLVLHGYCSDTHHRLLVYDFMANGGLHEHLYPVSNPNVLPTNLDWDTRLRIALEAAKGLEYLHEHVGAPVIHRDFKSSNILLDKNFHAKVSDFGLAKLGSEMAGGHVSTRVLGTHGYVVKTSSVSFYVSSVFRRFWSEN